MIVGAIFFGSIAALAVGVAVLRKATSAKAVISTIDINKG